MAGKNLTFESIFGAMNKHYGIPDSVLNEDETASNVPTMSIGQVIADAIDDAPRTYRNFEKDLSMQCANAIETAIRENRSLEEIMMEEEEEYRIAELDPIVEIPPQKENETLFADSSRTESIEGVVFM